MRILTGMLAATIATACSREQAGRYAGATDIYRYVRTGALAPIAARAQHLVYVPNSMSGTVTVLDEDARKVVRTIPTGAVPQHVVPSHDLTTLWATNNDGNTLTAIDPLTGQETRTIPVADPYNMYYTPDGKWAIVVAEQFRRLDFYNPQTMKREHSLPVDCRGVDHMDFTADDRYAIATCEFSGQLVKVDLRDRRVVGYLDLGGDGSMPQDIRSSADGRTFYVADMKADGVHLVDPIEFQKVGFVPTGKGAHGLVPSRDGRLMYVSNRGSNAVSGPPHGPGSVSVVDDRTHRVVETWPIPNGGSPDMGNLSTDGRFLWLSGRYDDEVYVFDVNGGRLVDRIPVGRQPHGLCVWPQPGRYSTGHTGNMR